ncbi:DNA-binding HxlR family transcriptional regulator [Bradyrhizobium yuanmingense]
MTRIPLKLEILFALMNGAVRFGALRRSAASPSTC